MTRHESSVGFVLFLIWFFFLFFVGKRSRKPLTTRTTKENMIYYRAKARTSYNFYFHGVFHSLHSHYFVILFKVNVDCFVADSNLDLIRDFIESANS